MNKNVLYCATVDYHFQAFHLPYMRWFKEKGWKVHVAASGEMELPFTDQKFNLPIERSPFHFNNIKAYKELKEIIDQNSYSIIHCHTPMGGVLARLAARAARKNGTKVIYTAHGFHFCKGAPLLNWLLYYPIEKILASLTDCLITINWEDYQLAKRRSFNAEKKVHVHGVGVDTNQFKPVEETEKQQLRKKYGYKENDFLLFYAAEFNKNKNQQFLLKALALAKDEMPNVRLLLAGKGPLLDECRRLAAQLGVEEIVDFLGYRNDMMMLVKMIDLAVASSYREGLPVNIMEAMASGLPIIATINRGHSQLVINGRNGYIISSEHVRLFSEKIIELYQSPSLCKSMGAKSKEIIDKYYSLPKVIEEISSLYSSYMMEDDNATKSKYRSAYI